MHNTIARVQAAFSHATSLAFFIALLITALSLLPLEQYYQYFPYRISSSSADPWSSPRLPTASLSPRNIQVVRGRPHYYSTKREEYAHVRFDLDADLSPLFDWNTKQVFVYVAVEYPATNGEVGQDSALVEGSGSRYHDHVVSVNKAVIWDAIIPAPASSWTVANIRERWFPVAMRSKTASSAKKKRQTKGDSDPYSSKDKSTTKAITKPGLLSLQNQKAKYQITDPSGIISSRPNATLTLSWNVQPWVGALLWDLGTLEYKTMSPPASEAGMSSFSSSWNLPFLRYQWQDRRQPRSEKFDFPPIKGAKKAEHEGHAQEVIKDTDGPQTPEPAEVSGVVQ